MDSGQLFHDLHQVLHRGVPLHAAAVVNLDRVHKAGVVLFCSLDRVDTTRVVLFFSLDRVDKTRVGFVL